MKESQITFDYRRMARAIEFIDTNARSRPTLDEIASEIGMSAYHFQRTFTRYVGLSPKKFLQAVSVEHVRRVLRESRPTLDAAAAAGLSGTGRLHDLCITLEAVPPGAYRTAGAELEIAHGVAPSPFGTCFVGITRHGICRLEFIDPPPSVSGEARITALDSLRAEWPRATFVEDRDAAAETIDTIFGNRSGDVRIFATGTNFQVQVWRALLAIPRGALTTYGDLADRIGRPGAARAVGGAVARNPVAYLIPCHRVIQRIGNTGGYRWGAWRKRAMLGGELSDTD